jgi:hypothetical protein
MPLTHVTPYDHGARSSWTDFLHPRSSFHTWAMSVMYCSSLRYSCEGNNRCLHWESYRTHKHNADIVEGATGTIRLYIYIWVYAAVRRLINSLLLSIRSCASSATIPRFSYCLRDAIPLWPPRSSPPSFFPLGSTGEFWLAISLGAFSPNARTIRI